jgi:hypothetical protein
MRQIARVYQLLRSQGHTRRSAIGDIYRWLDDLLTLYVALRVYEQNVRQVARDQRRPMGLARTIDRLWRRLMHGWPRTNCLFFAVALNARRKHTKNRRYISIRKSDSGQFWHFLYVEHRKSVRFISYKPSHPVDRKCPPMIFRGAVRWGDLPKEH